MEKAGKGKGAPEKTPIPSFPQNACIQAKKIVNYNQKTFLYYVKGQSWNLPEVRPDF